MGRQLDLAEIRRTIEAARAGNRAVHVSADFLEQLERELAAGRAAQAQLIGGALTGHVIESIEAAAR